MGEITVQTEEMSERECRWRQGGFGWKTVIAVFSLLGVLECSGLFEDVGALLARFAKSERSAEATIVLSAGILSMVTGVISVAIVALGNLVCEIGEKAGVDRYRRANLLDYTKNTKDGTVIL